MVDSLLVENSLPNCTSCACQPIASGSDLIDTIVAIAMVVIAIANIILTSHIFKQGRKDNTEGARKRRKFELLQSLILNNRLHILYDFYDAVSRECQQLLNNSDQETKMAVNDANIVLLKKFRQDFVMPFKVVDYDLFVGLKKTADDLVDGITEAIFDEGINLNHEPKFNEVISEPLSVNRNTMLAKLYEMADLDE